jgi:NadR type nicotinamide-nucleotide adenylyltransferase
MKRIVIIGPESTGKSTLCEQLAHHYKTEWCPEYARDYLLQHGTQYTYMDLLKIAEGQLILEDQIQERAGTHYFIDTNMYVMKVWCEVIFEDCHTWILKQIASRPYDLYLLCDTDLPWVQDELREYPDLYMRQRLFKTYKDIVINSGCPWVQINGVYHQRLQKAITAIDSLFLENK